MTASRPLGRKKNGEKKNCRPKREREKKEGGRGALHVSAVTVAPVARWRGEKKRRSKVDGRALHVSAREMDYSSGHADVYATYVIDVGFSMSSSHQS
jgi:hypothetical protein